MNVCSVTLMCLHWDARNLMSGARTGVLGLWREKALSASHRNGCKKIKSSYTEIKDL